MPNRKLPCLALLAAFLCAPGVSAVPILSIDADPAVAGIQSTVDVAAGASFSVDVVVEGVDPAQPLNGFQFNLGFAPGVLSPTAATLGPFLLAPAIPIASVLGPGSVLFAAATLFPVGASGDGLLATITFDAVNTGVSPLALGLVVLSAPGGAPIASLPPNAASVTVSAAAVTEPATLLAGSLGLGLLGWRRRRA